MRRPLSSISQLPSAATIRRGSRWKLRLALKGIQCASSLSWLARGNGAVCGMFIERASQNRDYCCGVARDSLSDCRTGRESRRLYRVDVEGATGLDSGKSNFMDLQLWNY